MEKYAFLAPTRIVLLPSDNVVESAACTEMKGKHRKHKSNNRPTLKILWGRKAQRCGKGVVLSRRASPMKPAKRSSLPAFLAETETRRQGACAAQSVRPETRSHGTPERQRHPVPQPLMHSRFSLDRPGPLGPLPPLPQEAGGPRTRLRRRPAVETRGRGQSQGLLPQAWAGTVRWGRWWHAGHGGQPPQTCRATGSGENGQVAGPARRAWHSRGTLTGAPIDDRSQDSQKEAAQTVHTCRGRGDPEEGDVGSPAERDI